MSQHANVDLQMVAIQGKKFNWKRPKCPKACHKMWVHAYVLRYLSGFPEGIYIKIYRCPICGAIISTLPKSYWKYYQTNVQLIYKAIKIRLTTYKWPPWTTRQRAGHWIKKFYSFIILNFPKELENPIQLLEHCYNKKLYFIGQISDSKI